MKKKLKKHIANQDYVKVYIIDEGDYKITSFEGIVFGQNDDFILMSDTYDFFYDGLVILRKKDVSEIRHSDNQRFMKQIMENEELLKSTLEKRSTIKFKLGTLQEMLTQLRQLRMAIIIECKYRNDDIFQIGPLSKVTKKRVKIDYFNAKGEYDLKPTSSLLEEITFIKFDSPYANTFYKYARRVK